MDMKVWIYISITLAMVLGVTVGLSLYTISSLEGQLENQQQMLFEQKINEDDALITLQKKHVKQIQDILKNVAYLGKVERLRESVMSRPIESLVNEDIGKLIEDELIQLPIASPFHDGYKVSAHYGDDVLEGYWRSHKGVDLVPAGSGIVYPAAEGFIAEIGEDAIYGKYIVIQHDGYRTKYAHLKTIYWQDIDNQTVVGATVDIDTRIGFYGNTGKTQPIVGDGSHLHYEVQWHDPIKDVYVPIDPNQFLTAGRELAKEGSDNGTDQV